MTIFIAQDFHSAPIFNGGVVAQKAKNREAEKVCNFFASILEIFRLYFRAKVLRVLFAARKEGEHKLKQTFCECSGSPSNVGAKSCAQMFSQYDNIIAQDFHSAPILMGEFL